MANLRTYATGLLLWALALGWVLVATLLYGPVVAKDAARAARDLGVN